MCDHTENSCNEILDINNSSEQSGFKFSLDSIAIKPPSPSPVSSPLTTSNLKFASQSDLGRLFALQGNGGVTSESGTSSPSGGGPEQIEHSQQFLHKISRPIPPSLNTNFSQFLMSHNGSNFSSPPYQSDSIDDGSGHRRRDSNVSTMSIQLHDVVPGHQRRDSNVSSMSMQLDTPTPSSGTESGNEDESKSASFPFTFSQKPLTLSRPSTPTTPPPYPSSFYSAPTARTSVSSLISHHPQRMRRMSLDISIETGSLNYSPDGKIDKPSPMHRAVRARRASLLPKTKSFQRVANELQEEARPIEAEIKQEYKTTKVLKNESDNIMDTGKLSEEFLNNWIKFRDIQPSPPPYTASRLNPEIELAFRQDTPSPTSSVGPWPSCSRIKRKASDDRFEPYFNPKRRAVSPSLVGSPPIVSGLSSPSANGSPSYSSYATGSPSNGGVGGNGCTPTSRGQIKSNSGLAILHDANGSFSRMNLNGE
ncbi:28578_t:CDS:2 [Dentiscutata erythropus]|uniref:28578_t:CDS:1 n=1 Tax=Dentiscutata erythropus TaxID=1348616 RepID=A0A9N9BM30_9GLOM|nr:28578_t:CDS:2 [Dentiscutata erythropus]